ncbi:hypothetical protein Tco_0168310, partial [Tanacetum coccineum]
MLESSKNGPLVYLSVEENGQIQKKKYVELTKQEQLQDDCDVQATNIVLQGLPPDMYALVKHCQSAKDIWERISSIPQTPHHPLPYQQGFQTQLNHTPTSVPQNAYHTPPIAQQPQAEFPQLDSGFAVPSFLPDGMVTIEQVQVRQGQSFVGTRTKGNATSSGGNNVAGKDVASSSTGTGQVLDEEQLAFLADPGVVDDAHDSDYDDISSAKAVLMANLSSYGSDVLSK